MAELRGVHKTYRRRPVLLEVDLSLRSGEVTGLVGPNGAGKSTCLRLLVGLTRRDGGEAAVFGHDPSRHGPRIRRRCSYLPGETSLYHNMTGRELLDFALAFYPRRLEQLGRQLAERFELPMAQRIRRYSAGMKQKLAVLAALSPDVDLYLLDEPDRNLDPSARAVLREALAELRGRGKAVGLTSHHLGELEATAQRLVFLLAGRSVGNDRVRAARERLRRSVRLELVAGAEPPGGTAEITRQADGKWYVVPDGEPLEWLARLDPALVVSAEIGPTRLDDLYHLLVPAEGAAP